MSDLKQLAGGERSDAPSGYKIESVISAWQAARDHLLTSDPSLQDDEAALIEALGPEDADVHSILSRLLRGALHARDMAAAADERAKLIHARRDRYRRRAETAITAAFNIMQITGERRLELPDLVASIRRGPESVFVTSEDDLPDAYWREVTTRTPDKGLIGKALKAGTDVPGATLANGAENLALKGT